AFEYDWIAPRPRTHVGRIVNGPWKLGELLNRADGFIYVGGVGFLDRVDDARSFEFSYLRRHGRKVVCYFTGNDIRSPRLSKEREERTGEPNLATYLAETGPGYATDAYETEKRALAESAEQF